MSIVALKSDNMNEFLDLRETYVNTNDKTSIFKANIDLLYVYQLIRLDYQEAAANELANIEKVFI